MVVTLLALDLGVLHKGDREIGTRESLLLSGGSIGVALLFGAGVWWYLGAQSGMDDHTGFLIEKSLSMDSVFVTALIFSYFIVYTSNIFAILGLRALHFALAAMIDRFKYLEYALALVLVFVGAKIVLVGVIGKIPAVISLSVTCGLIAGGVAVSLWKTRDRGPVLVPPRG